MKLSKNGYRLTKNGKPILSIEKEAIVRERNLSNILDGRLKSVIQENGIYYYLNRIQGKNYIYLP